MIREVAGCCREVGGYCKVGLWLSHGRCGDEGGGRFKYVVIR